MTWTLRMSNALLLPVGIFFVAKANQQVAILFLKSTFYSGREYFLPVSGIYVPVPLAIINDYIACKSEKTPHFSNDLSRMVVKSLQLYFIYVISLLPRPNLV